MFKGEQRSWKDVRPAAPPGVTAAGGPPQPAHQGRRAGAAPAEAWPSNPSFPDLMTPDGSAAAFFRKGRAGRIALPSVAVSPAVALFFPIVLPGEAFTPQSAPCRPSSRRVVWMGASGRCHSALVFPRMLPSLPAALLLVRLFACVRSRPWHSLGNARPVRPRFGWNLSHLGCAPGPGGRAARARRKTATASPAFGWHAGRGGEERVGARSNSRSAAPPLRRGEKKGTDASRARFPPILEPDRDRSRAAGDVRTALSFRPSPESHDRVSTPPCRRQTPRRPKRAAALQAAQDGSSDLHRPLGFAIAGTASPPLRPPFANEALRRRPPLPPLPPRSARPVAPLLALARRRASGRGTERRISTALCLQRRLDRGSAAYARAGRVADAGARGAGSRRGRPALRQGRRRSLPTRRPWAAPAGALSRRARGPRARRPRARCDRAARRPPEPFVSLGWQSTGVMPG